MNKLAVILIMIISTTSVFTYADVSVHRLSTVSEVPIKAGTTLSIHRRVCLDEDILVRAYSRFVHTESGVTHTPPTPAEYFLPAKKGCYNYAFIVEVPKVLPRGDYTFEPIVSYSLNGEIYIQAVPTEKFTIH